MKRIIAILMVFCILAALGGCTSRVDGWDLTVPTRGETQETTQATTEQTEPPEVVEYPVTYELTDTDLQEFYALLDACEQLALDGTDLDGLEQTAEQLEDKFDYLTDQTVAAQIIYYCDLSDESASGQYLDAVDLSTQAKNDYMEMLRRVYQSDSAAKETLFADWTQQELAMLEAYSEEIMELEKRNSEILVAYQSLEDQTADDMVPLYLEQVRNNNRIARIYGYENYYEFASQMVYYRDYDTEQLSALRQYTAQYLAPAAEDCYNGFSQVISALSKEDRESLVAFLESGYEECPEAYFENYLDTLPESVRADMLDALENGNAYFATSRNAQEGAFTAQLGQRLLCFFGPGYENSLTVAHELGHYYSGLYCDLDVTPLDLAETQSQGNEWLFLGQLEGQMDGVLYDALICYEAYVGITNVLICVLVDAFEERIYSEPDLENFTGEDLNRVMEEVCEPYGGVDYIREKVTDIQSYWRCVVVESPVYYVSYAVSGIAAMNLYAIYQEEPEKAVETYRSLVEREQWDQGFLEVISEAGLPGPFEESGYLGLLQMFSQNEVASAAN